MPLKKTAAQLVAEANEQISMLTAYEAFDLHQKGQAVLVDIRDISELGKMGKVPEAVHAPRGMLEFWIDPESPYHRADFAQIGKTYIFFCASAWRSALATFDIQNMGFGPVAHIEGGFTAWKDAGLPVEMPDEKKS